MAKTPSRRAQLHALYASLPTIRCRGKCQNACGPIGMSREERTIIVKATGSAPHAPLPRQQCTKLGADGRCTIYSIRPLICRLYGVVPEMRCPHGCLPSRWLTRPEAFALMREAVRIGGKDTAGAKEVLAIFDELQRSARGEDRGEPNVQAR